MVKKSAFTLNELIISLFVFIIFITFGVIFVIKNNENKIKENLSGEYACWVQDNELYEWYFYDKIPKTLQPIKVSKCSFNSPNKNKLLYIVATGAGGNNISGQLVTKHTNFDKKKLNITIGRHNSDKETTNTIISTDYETEIIANSVNLNLEFKNFVSNNIKSCKIVKDYSKNKCANSCEIVDFLDSDNISKKMIKINGCENFSVDVNNIDNYIDFKNVKLVNETSRKINLQSVDENDIHKYSLANNVIFTGVDNSLEKRRFDFNLDFFDSGFSNGLDLSNDDVNSSKKMLSSENKMSDLIKILPFEYRTSLTYRLIKGNYGSPKNNGAVFIIW